MRCTGTRRTGTPGGIRPGFLVTLVILASLGFAGSRVVPIYWNYLAMQDPVTAAAFTAARPGGKEAEARMELIARAKSLGVDLAEDAVEFGQEGNHMVVRVAWEAPLDLVVYRRILRFRVEKSALVP
jgi:hypothetical protein